MEIQTVFELFDSKTSGSVLAWQVCGCFHLLACFLPEVIFLGSVMIPWFTIRRSKSRNWDCVFSLWRFGWHLFLPCLLQPSSKVAVFAVRAGIQQGITGKNIRGPVTEYPRIWNYLVSTSVIHLAICDSLTRCPAVCFQRGSSCEVSLFSMWSTRRLHARSCGQSSHQYLDTPDEGTSWYHVFECRFWPGCHKFAGVSKYIDSV